MSPTFVSGQSYSLRFRGKPVVLPFLERVDPPHGECSYFHFGDGKQSILAISCDDGQSFSMYKGNRSLKVKVSPV